MVVVAAGVVASEPSVQNHPHPHTLRTGACQSLGVGPSEGVLVPVVGWVDLVLVGSPEVVVPFQGSIVEEGHLHNHRAQPCSLYVVL